jgi:hypothetical protein
VRKSRFNEEQIIAILKELEVENRARAMGFMLIADKARTARH